MELISNENGDATGITGELGLRYGLKFSIIVKNVVYKITSVEIDALDLPLSEYKTLSANSLNLYCLLKELKHDDKFKMLFKYIIPVNKLVSLAAIYNDMAMLPSIGQIIVEESFGLETSVEEILTRKAGKLSDEVNTLLEKINTQDLELPDRREGAWAHPRDRSSRNGLLVQSWDTWDRELLINSTARIKKLFKSYYNSRDFDPSSVSENVDGPGKIFEKSLRDLFRPAAGRQLLPWYKRRNLKENPFNSLGEICKKDDEWLYIKEVRMSFQPRILGGDMSRSSSDGFEQIEDLKSNIKQNLKMLLLTNPGERVMDPNFGVGISRYLFEMMSDSVYSEIDSLIKEKVSIYMPYVNIQRIQFFEDIKRDNKINMKILYSVPRVSLNDSMTVNVT